MISKQQLSRYYHSTPCIVLLSLLSVVVIFGDVVLFFFGSDELDLIISILSFFAFIVFCIEYFVLGALYGCFFSVLNCKQWRKSYCCIVYIVSILSLTIEIFRVSNKMKFGMSYYHKDKMTDSQNVSIDQIEWGSQFLNAFSM